MTSCISWSASALAIYKTSPSLPFDFLSVPVCGATPRRPWPPRVRPFGGSNPRAERGAGPVGCVVLQLLDNVGFPSNLSLSVPYGHGGRSSHFGGSRHDLPAYSSYLRQTRAERFPLWSHAKKTGAPCIECHRRSALASRSRNFWHRIGHVGRSEREGHDGGRAFTALRVATRAVRGLPLVLMILQPSSSIDRKHAVNPAGGVTRRV